ncbi:hypothetical protein SCHPADRAFT_944238 [Schizopora paradoxa]|uniref:Smr domain-containing protein n=1 Tax=Schizopora paradoxa TaxID=27342 RepID=A0A0H2RGN7_9AGAM|nr:hypothetical protein SCHPADRAFT_944238 [Schizopora paradoxa]
MDDLEYFKWKLDNYELLTTDPNASDAGHRSQRMQSDAEHDTDTVEEGLADSFGGHRAYTPASRTSAERPTPTNASNSLPGHDADNGRGANRSEASHPVARFWTTSEEYLAWKQMNPQFFATDDETDEGFYEGSGEENETMLEPDSNQEPLPFDYEDFIRTLYRLCRLDASNNPDPEEGNERSGRSRPSAIDVTPEAFLSALKLLIPGYQQFSAEEMLQILGRERHAPRLIPRQSPLPVGVDESIGVTLRRKGTVRTAAADSRSPTRPSSQCLNSPSLPTDDSDENLPFAWVLFTPVKIRDIKDLELADYFREKARGERELANAAMQEAIIARNQRNYVQSQIFEESARKHRDNTSEFFRNATFHTFKYYNPDYNGVKGGRWLEFIDLHGLSVQDARRYVTKHLKLCKNANLDKTTIITGVGNRSEGGIPKIRPAILRTLKETREVAKGELDIENEGQVIVQMHQAQI